MFKALREMAGILVLLAAVVVLVALVINSSVSAKDIREGAGKLVDKAANVDPSDIFRQKVKADPSAQEQESASTRVIDSAARALKQNPSSDVAAGRKSPAPNKDEIDAMLKEAIAEGDRTKPAKAPTPSARRPAGELAKPAELVPAESVRRRTLKERGVTAPAAPRTRERIHVVRKGETLYRIALISYGDGKMWKEIARANAISDPSKVGVGARLRLPPKR